MAATFSPDSSDAAKRAFRSSLGRFATGVTVVTTRLADGAYAGLTVNSFSSVSLEPPLVLWSIGTDSSGYLAFSTADHFCINVLARPHEDIAMAFAKSDGAKFDAVAYTEGVGGAPVLDEALAAFECVKEAHYPGGDHLIVVGRVARVQMRESGDAPLVFYQGAFCGVET